MRDSSLSPCTPCGAGLSLRMTRKETLLFLYKRQGQNWALPFLLYLWSLLDTAQHLLKSGSIKPYHHFVAGRDHRNTSCSRNLHHLVQCGSVFGDIVFREFVAFLRKELFRHFAIGSGRCRNNFNLFLCHDDSSSFIDWFTASFLFLHPSCFSCQWMFSSVSFKD